jgi:hypothetical protein
MFPCTGSTHNCKSPTDQVAEVVNYLAAESLEIKRLWFDLEPPASNSPCQGWDFSKERNAKLAREFIAAIKATGLEWGVYANGNQWTAMFPSRDTDVASDLPLWAVQWDGVATIGSVKTFMGGWNKAFAKQYGMSKLIP